jgi:glycosyltransferase involved in cell wall biosynthesis
VPDRGLQIGIDARELCGHPTGVGRYLAGLLHAWARDPQISHRFTLVLPDDPPAAFDRLDNRFVFVVDRAKNAGTWWEQTRLPRLAERTGVHVWFSPGYTAPLRLPCPSVVAVHDVAFFAHPEWFSWREGLRRRWITRAAARRARVVITISEFSRDEIVRRLGIPRARVRLAPPGAPVAVGPAATGPREPIVLFVGSLFNRRRIPDLISGFKRVADRVPGAKLILVGDNRTSPAVDPRAVARELGIADQVEWRAYVSDDELDRLYWRARVFVFLSEYEGFAMTPLEALAHDVPSVLLDSPVAREVYGSAARYVTGLPDVALLDLMTDESARTALIEQGRPLLQTYSWARAATVVRQAVEDAARS